MSAPTSRPTVVDLDGPELTWGEHAIAGAEMPAAIAMLRFDAERSTRTVVVAFPDGWTRDAVGNQPAGEEMVLLEGELRVSGLTCGVGDLLVVEPRATRSATSTLDGTRAVVFFSGPGGGWVDGEAADAGSATVLPLRVGTERPANPGLVGAIVVRDDVAGTVLDVDADVLWPQSRRWAFVPAGAAVPAIDGLALVHAWG